MSNHNKKFPNENIKPSKNQSGKKQKCSLISKSLAADLLPFVSTIFFYKFLFTYEELFKIFGIVLKEKSYFLNFFFHSLI